VESRVFLCELVSNFDDILYNYLYSAVEYPKEFKLTHQNRNWERLVPQIKQNFTKFEKL
jgi:hypothetical protein